MMNAKPKPRVAVRYFDGKINRAHQAELSPDDEGGVCLTFGEQTLYFDTDELAYLASVGGVLPAIELPNDARIEFLSHDVPDWLPVRHKTMLHHVSHFEQSWRWVAVGFVVVACVIFGTFNWGIPAAAHYLAFNLPESTLHSAGDKTETLLLTHFTAPSKLPEKRQQEVKNLYYQTLAPEKPAKILIVSGQNIGANAFAIPNNTIVLTDELIKLAQNDHEILAVLAHEQGHLTHRHSFQQVLRGVGVGLFLVVITGDANDLVNGLPTLLITAQYSQAFEMEADQFAIDALKAKGISPQHLATFLQRLHDAHDHGESEDSVTQVLSTHPMTSERVKQIQQHTD